MAEITKTDDENRLRSPWIPILIAAAIAVFYFFGLGIPLVGPDEPRYTQVAREMFERGDWVTPTLGGFNWFEKPALLYWLEIASFHLFGVTEFAARFGSALFGLGTVFSLWLLGRFGDVRAHAAGSRTSFANWLALIAASSLGVIVFSRGASFDIVLTFPITAAMVCFYIFDSIDSDPESKSNGVPWLAGAYFFVGVSLLAKGLVGVVFPAAIAAFYYILSWRMPSKRAIFSILWGTPITLATASLWYVPMYMQHGWSFIDEFFVQHHFQRYTSNKYFHPQPFYFFFWVLPLMTIPWIPFFFAAAWKLAKRTYSGISDGGSKVSPLLRFAAAWMLVPLVFFSFSGSKLPGYILPAVPAALLITSVYVWKLVNKSETWKFAMSALAAATFIVIAALLQFVVPNFAYQDSVKGLIAAADANGYTGAKILNLHTTSHNAEFYGAGRLISTDDGKQRKFLGVLEIVDYFNKSGDKSALVLVPHEYIHQLTESKLFDTVVLDESGEIAIVAVKPTPSAADGTPQPVH